MPRRGEYRVGHRVGENGCWIWQGTRHPKGYGNCTRLFDGIRVQKDLFLGTAADNSADMVGKGRSTCGERHHRAKLSTEMVRDIRSRVAEGETQAALAREYGVAPATLHQVVHEKSWRAL
jgi:hypothetical protein